jgi:ABC-type spermidine/putrescine transport system permease subunit I
MKAIPNNLLQASSDLGASPFTTFSMNNDNAGIKVTWMPVMTPSLVKGTITFLKVVKGLPAANLLFTPGAFLLVASYIYIPFMILPIFNSINITCY